MRRKFANVNFCCLYLKNKILNARSGFRKDGLPGERTKQTDARVAMVHSIPELVITLEVRKSEISTKRQ